MGFSSRCYKINNNNTIESRAIIISWCVPPVDGLLEIINTFTYDCAAVTSGDAVDDAKPSKYRLKS